MTGTELVAYVAPLPAAESTAAHYMTVKLGDIRFAIPLSQIAWVMPYEAPTPVPLAPAIVKGLLHARGQLVTVMDLASRLTLPAFAPKRLVVIHHGDDEKLGLTVEEVGDIIAIDPARKQRLPTKTEPWQHATTGMVLEEGGLLMLLDVKQLVS